MFQSIGHEFCDNQRHPKCLTRAELGVVHMHIWRDILSAEHSNEAETDREATVFEQSWVRRLRKKPSQRDVRKETIFEICEHRLSLGQRRLPSTARDRVCNQLKAVGMPVFQLLQEDRFNLGTDNRCDLHTAR